MVRRVARRRVNTGWLLASVASLLFLGFGAGIALVAVGGLGGSSDSLVFGVPRSAGWLLWLPVLGAVATGRDRQRLRDGIGRTRSVGALPRWWWLR